MHVWQFNCQIRFFNFLAHMLLLLIGLALAWEARISLCNTSQWFEKGAPWLLWIPIVCQLSVCTNIDFLIYFECHTCDFEIELIALCGFVLNYAPRSNLNIFMWRRMVGVWGGEYCTGDGACGRLHACGVFNGACTLPQGVNMRGVITPRQT